MIQKKELSESLGRMLWMTHRQLRKSMCTALEKSEDSITFYQFIILKILYHHEEIVQQDLADLMQQDKSSILRQIRALEKNRLMVKVEDSSDKRRNFLVLTQKGVRVVEKALVIDERKQKEFIKGITKAEFESFEKVLSKIKENAL